MKRLLSLGRGSKKATKSSDAQPGRSAKHAEETQRSGHSSEKADGAGRADDGGGARNSSAKGQTPPPKIPIRTTSLRYSAEQQGGGGGLIGGGGVVGGSAASAASAAHAPRDGGEMIGGASRDQRHHRNAGTNQSTWQAGDCGVVVMEGSNSEGVRRDGGGGGEEAPQCGICNIVLAREVHTLPCGHAFHKKW
jgi:hypothetical protein